MVCNYIYCSIIYIYGTPPTGTPPNTGPKLFDTRFHIYKVVTNADPNLTPNLYGPTTVCLTLTDPQATFVTA